MNKKKTIIIIIAATLVIAISFVGVTLLDKEEVTDVSSTEAFVTVTTEFTTVTTADTSKSASETSTEASSTSTSLPDTSESTSAGTTSAATESSTSETTKTTTQTTSAETTTEAQGDNTIVKLGKIRNSDNQQSSVVYFTKDISPEGLVKIYEALGVNLTGKTGVKISTGESSQSNYLEPNLIKDLVQKLNGTICECNTAYGGVRSSTALHKQLAADHGFTAIADVDIMDADGSLKIPINGGTHLTYNLVGSHFTNYNSFLVLSHFKGHPMGGFGGAIKNSSIGMASKQGKCRIHTAGQSNTVMLGLDQDAFLECMAEASKSVKDYMNGQITYINVMNNLSVDCDCMAITTPPVMADVGILASNDPVALDRACVDIVYYQKDGDGKTLVNRIESKNGLHTLEYAEQIGLGSQNYTLVSID